MTTAACSKWKGLFSVEELDDDDLLDADWTHASDSGASAVRACAPLQESHAACSHDAQQSSVAQSAILSNRSSPVTDCSARHELPGFEPVKCLRSLAKTNVAAVLHPVPPHTRTASSAVLQASSGDPNATWSPRRPSVPPPGRSNPRPGVCDVPRRVVPAQDDFDDWDVDLEELDECVPREASAPGTASASDTVSPAKRTRSSAAEKDEAPVASSLRGFCNSTPKPAPPHSFVRPSSATAFSPQNFQPSAAPSRRFTGPLTPGAVRAACRWPGDAVAPRAEPRALFQAVSPAPSAPRTPRPLHMPLLTNHLVQLVSAANKTPRRPRSDSARPKTRRFPGPAGALPQQISGRSLDDIVVAVPQTPAHGAVARLHSEVPSSQVNDEDEFSAGPWAAMKADMGLDERNLCCFLHSFSVVMVLRKAALKQLSKNKVPNMAVVLKSILHTHADAKAVFRDPTGEMQGTVHRRLLEDRQVELKTGAVLLLKQVGVFSPSNRNHYLNVTPNNLLRIYPPDGAVQASSRHSQPAPGPAEVPHWETSKPDRGPVSQMELLYDDEEEEEEGKEEQRNIPDKPPLSANGPGHSAPDRMEDARWDADDLDELLGELPVDSYCA